MPGLSEADRRDILLLRKLIAAIVRFLSWLVADSSWIPADVRGPFLEVRPIALGRLRAADEQLSTVDDTDSPIWRRLDDAGLVGPPLHLKAVLWERTAATVSQAGQPTTVPPRGILGRALQPILRLINSLVGSLAAVFPPLELVTEYKDGVELVIEESHTGPAVPGDILGIR